MNELLLAGNICSKKRISSALSQVHMRETLMQTNRGPTLRKVTTSVRCLYLWHFNGFGGLFLGVLQKDVTIN